MCIRDSSLVERELPKLERWVRFPSSAPNQKALAKSVGKDFFVVIIIICHIVFMILSLQGSSLHVNIFYEEGPHCVEYCQNHDTYIGEDGKPHIRDSQCPQKQAEEFDTCLLYTSSLS